MCLIFLISNQSYKRADDFWKVDILSQLLLRNSWNQNSMRSVSVFRFSSIFQFLKHINHHICPQHNIQERAENMCLFSSLPTPQPTQTCIFCCRQVIVVFFIPARKGRPKAWASVEIFQRRHFASNCISLSCLIHNSISIRYI